jgi:hypothetical protein
LILVKKKWLVDPKDGCKSHSNMVELVEKDLNFEKELEVLEGSFEYVIKL